jgi:hypothetical protein
VVPVVAGSSPVRHLVRPRSSADRAAGFEPASGGSTPPGAITALARKRLAPRAPRFKGSGGPTDSNKVRLRRSWIGAALAFAFAIYAVYAAVVLLTTPDSELNDFVTRWLYQGLIAGAVVIAAARAVLVARDRLA